MFSEHKLSTSLASYRALGARGLRFLPPIAWTLLIAWLSSPGWSAADTGSRLLPALKWLAPFLLPEQIEAIHWVIRKTAHVVEYGVLAALWFRALRTRTNRRGWLIPLGLCALTASLDEIHQATTLTRGGSALDVLLDSAGAAAVLLMLRGGVGYVLTWLTGGLLWLAAVGGAALIAVDATVGAPAGWLWVSVPAAWIALALWHRQLSR
jgi:VanZ family protein